MRLPVFSCFFEYFDDLEDVGVGMVSHLDFLDFLLFVFLFKFLEKGGEFLLDV